MNATNVTIEGPLVKCASALSHSVYSGAVPTANIIVTTLSALVQVSVAFLNQCVLHEL